MPPLISNNSCRSKGNWILLSLYALKRIYIRKIISLFNSSLYGRRVDEKYTFVIFRNDKFDRISPQESD